MPEDVGDEPPGDLDRAVDMGFGGEVDHRVHPADQAGGPAPGRQMSPLDQFNFKPFQVPPAGVGQLVQHDDPVAPAGFGTRDVQNWSR